LRLSVVTQSGLGVSGRCSDPNLCLEDLDFLGYSINSAARLVIVSGHIQYSDNGSCMLVIYVVTLLLGINYKGIC